MSTLMCLLSPLQMMKHAWDGYSNYAWGKNELRPVTKRGHSASIFGSAAMGASIVDGMVRSEQIEFIAEISFQSRNYILHNIICKKTLSVKIPFSGHICAQ